MRGSISYTALTGQKGEKKERVARSILGNHATSREVIPLQLAESGLEQYGQVPYNWVIDCTRLVRDVDTHEEWLWVRDKSHREFLQEAAGNESGTTGLQHFGEVSWWLTE